MTKELRVTITVRNAVLLRAIEAAGYNSVARFAKDKGVPYSAVLAYIALTRAPYGRDGELQPSIVAIANALRSLPEDLFPPAFLKRAMARNKVTREVDAQDLAGLIGAAQANPEQALEVSTAGDALHAALEELPPRRAEVLRMRFGLGSYEPHTLEQVARKIGATRERVRQIELSALRQLKHPSRSTALRQVCAPILEAQA